MSRFWTKVHPQPTKDGCWLWMAGKMTGGYGQMYDAGQRHAAHRWLYERVNGPVPDGFELDHLCRNRACVNPHHLEPVTHEENMRRGISYWSQRTHCSRGHEFTPENTNLNNGYRLCRACKRENTRKSRGGLAMIAALICAVTFSFFSDPGWYELDTRGVEWTVQQVQETETVASISDYLRSL